MDSDTQQLIEKKFAEATEHHSSGNLEAAMLLYQEIHEMDNKHADSIHLMGLAFHQLGQTEQASQLIGLAISIKPNEASYYSNYGSVQKGLGNIEEALAAYQKASEIDPLYLAPYFNSGEVLCSLGRVEEGEAAYRKAIEINSDVPDVWTNLGVCVMNQNRQEEAEECFTKALLLDPSFSTALYSLGRLKLQNDLLDEANVYLTQAKSAGFNEVECLHQLSSITERQRNYALTIQYLNRVIELGGANADSYNNLALAYQNLGEMEKAKAAVDRALELDPSSIVALCTSAAFLNELGEFENAITQSKKAISFDPKCEIAFLNLGGSYRALLRLDESESTFREGLDIAPECAELHNNLALVLQHKGETDPMIHHFERAIEIRPDYASAYSNFGSALIRCGLLTRANELLEKAIDLDAAMVAAWFNLGRLRHEMGDAEGSLQSYDAGLGIDPNSLRCWLARASTQIGRADASDEDVFQKHVDAGTAIERLCEAVPLDLSSRLLESERKLKIGFISADFKVHSVAYFLLPLFRNIDSERYELHCYSSVESPDSVTAEFEALSAGWNSIVQLPDEKAVELISNDQIDILIDLSGATAGNRMTLFGYKPAPVQASWLGYAHSSGMSRMDYRIVDANTDPEGMTLNTEELIRMPETFLVYSPRGETPDVAPSPVSENGTITFGSFNNLTKLNRKSIELFSKALLAVDGSRLVLKSHQTKDTEVRDRIWRLFAAQGIDQDRVELIPRYENLNEHLEAYGRIDIALDTFPYNGTTTTCEAAWMGVPVVTLAGTRHAARVGCSLLNSLGLNECVANSEDEFVSIAQGLAEDTTRLNELRSGMRERFENSPLRDEKRFAEYFGKAMDAMWEAYKASASQGV